ncbi:glycosyltransferase family 39 protein [Streptomyces sp. OF8]|uniref:Glycosyltransferase n=2 Tax=Streptomyces alkaliterrae TaxID=2213162 RepID=A0A5P0YWD5_9ACTN|nr:glycosyltransferase family 39 protein [Streptomyces alkaliterrae]MQS04594.1 glycosyltransferase [Streptomyces alkaliterrae]
MLAVGAGGWLPGWQPWPLLLLAAPLLWWGRDAAGAPPGRTPGTGRGRLADTATARGGRAGLRLSDRWLGAVGLGTVLSLTVAVWAALQDHEPWIGHEEAVYANKARSWTADGPPDAGWGPYRPPGLPLLGTIALRVHPDVGALRTVTLLLALLTLTIVWLVAARWTTPVRAALVTLLVLSGLGFLRRMPEFLTDIGATGLLLLVVYLVTRAQERPESRALLLLPPVVLAAFYLRYGVVGNLCAIGLAALLAYGPRAWAARARDLAVAAGLVLLGLLPHFMQATALTGWPLGLITWATSQAERSFIGDGLLYYLAIFPYRLAGDLGAVVMVAGLAAAVGAARRLRAAGAWRRPPLGRDRSRRAARSETGRPPGPGQRSEPGQRSDDRSAVKNRPGVEDRRQVFLAATAVLLPVVLGTATDGEPRFVYLSVVLLTILGVQALATWAGDRRRAVLAGVAGMAALTVLGTAQVVAHGAMPGPTGQNRSTVPVARAVAAEADGRPCLVVTGYVPETGWYSGCDAVTYRQYRRLPERPPADRVVHFVRYERGRLQPDAEGVARLTEGLPSRTWRLPTDGSLGIATIVTLR